MVDLSLIYDKFAKKYEDNRNIFNMDNIINDLNKYINISQGKLLDLGCGAGEPFSSYFIKKKWDVIGVDYSSEMLKIANKYLPQLKTIYSDMTLVKFNINQFDLVIAIYSIFHIEKEKHTQLLKNIYFWLK
ncbi:MAG: class I SAM-dependent methyltransferase, partial [Candidatus Cloacimonetes bacterium]|nr:class I SAM-dependent methyltransferase [Candidatus Cloacimonadota bacterium]